MDLGIQNYKVMGKIGEGAHGVVLRAFDTANKQYVALKRMLSKQEEDLPICALREVKSLQHVNSPYVMKLLGILTGGSSLVLVLELMAGGLGTVIYDVDHPMSVSQYKAYARMALTGLSHLHQNNIMHRDLKPANLLIGYDGVLKIADLGQARLARGRPFSHQVGSRWYRAPELLYGSRRYTCAVDMWSMGVIIAEMINKSPLFPGESDIEQLAIVVKCLGTPSQESWPGLKNLPDFNKIHFPTAKGKSWKSLIPDPPPSAVHLIRCLVVYNPAQRLSAENAVKNKFFAMEPKTLEDDEITLPLSLRGRLTAPRRRDIALDNTADQMTAEFTSMFDVCTSIDDVKINIRAVMSTCRNDMTYASLIVGYEELVCKPMALCGFGTCVELINSIPDIVQVIPGKPNRLRLVPSAKSQHIVKLVKQQKSITVPKKIPSRRKLAALGIRPPEESTTKQSVNKLKTRDIPSRVNNTISSSRWPPVSELRQNDPNWKRSSTTADTCHTTAKNECKQNVNSQVVQSQSNQVRDDRRSVVIRPREETKSSASQWPPVSELWQNGSNWKRSSTSADTCHTTAKNECKPKVNSKVVQSQSSQVRDDRRSVVTSSREEINSSASQWPPLKGLWLNNTNWKCSSTSDHEHRANGISECEPNLPSRVVHGQSSKLPINDRSSVKSTFDRQLYMKIKNLDLENIDQYFEDI